MRDGNRVGPALGKRCLRWVIGGVKIDIRHFANQVIRPVACAQARLFARHEFQSAVHAKVQKSISVKGSAQPVVELDEGKGRRKTTLEQQAHRIAFIAECWLQAHEHIAKMLAQNEH